MSWPKKAGTSREKYKAYMRQYYKTGVGAFHNKKRNAINRGIEWELSQKDFLSLEQQPCFYCGEKPEKMGIDRIDNAIGYVMGNVRPCCWTCNRMKFQHSTDFFVARCKLIASRS